MIEDEIQMINDTGGINGKMIELIFLNDECKSEKGIANAQKLARTVTTTQRDADKRERTKYA